MTDRELLEDAAMTEQETTLLLKAGAAAGLDVGVIHQRPHRRCAEGWTPWNPITDDGDALRLLVRLGSAKVAAMEIGPGGTCLSFFHPEADADEMQEPGKPFDPYAATRRAIVRAAAEIGRSMT